MDILFCTETGLDEYDLRSSEVFQVEGVALEGQDFHWPEPDSYMASYRPYRVVDGELTVYATGALVGGGYYSSVTTNYATGYKYIQAAITRAKDDPQVRQVRLVIDSHGGEATGAFDTAELILDLRASKPVIAEVSRVALSAGYLLASAATRIEAKRMASLGSIGVLTVHRDISKMMTDVGVVTTYIYAGKHKIDGNPHEPLPDDVKARIQAQIDWFYDAFVKAVSGGRNIAEQVVRDTEAGVYLAHEALTLGLIDDIVALTKKRTITGTGATVMSEKDEQALAAEAQAKLDAENAAQVASAAQASAKAERERVSGILNCEEAKERPELASHLALATDLSVEAAVAILAASPVAAKPQETGTPGANFDAAMGNGTGVGAGEGSGEGTEMSAAEKLKADYQLATGFKPKAQ